MPLHVQPVLRALELAAEAEGLIQPINSAGYTAVVAAENAGVRPPKPVPLITHKLRGNVYVAS